MGGVAMSASSLQQGASESRVRETIPQPHSSYVAGYTPYGAAYGAGAAAPNGGHYAAAAPHAVVPYPHGHFGHPYHPGYHGYGGHSIVHADRVANTEMSARASDFHFAKQE